MRSPTRGESMETVKLEAIDGGSVRAFVARPEGEPKGCVVVAQEIFGVNDHIRWVLAEQYAKAGYLAVAPAFFDRLEPDAEFGYTPETTARGRARSSTGSGSTRRCATSGPRSSRSRAGCPPRRRLLLGRHGRLPGGHAARAARGRLLRRAHRAPPARAAAGAADAALRRARRADPDGHREAHQRDAPRRALPRLPDRPRLQPVRASGLARGLGPDRPRAHARLLLQHLRT